MPIKSGTEFREALAGMGLNVARFARTLIRLGDPRNEKTLYRVLARAAEDDREPPAHLVTTVSLIGYLIDQRELMRQALALLEASPNITIHGMNGTIDQIESIKHDLGKMDAILREVRSGTRSIGVSQPLVS